MNKEEKNALFTFYVNSLIVTKPEMNNTNINVLVRVYPEMDAGMTITNECGDTIILECDLTRDELGQPKAIFTEIDFSSIGI